MPGYSGMAWVRVSKSKNNSGQLHFEIPAFIAVLSTNLWLARLQLITRSWMRVKLMGVTESKEMAFCVEFLFFVGR